MVKNRLVYSALAVVCLLSGCHRTETLISQNDNYNVVQVNKEEIYRYEIYSNSGDIVKEGQNDLCPVISVSDGILRLYLPEDREQTANHRTFFYDIDKDIWSDEFQYIVAHYGHMAAFIVSDEEEQRIVRVCDVFAPEEVYEDIKRPFSKDAPIEKVLYYADFLPGNKLFLSYWPEGVPRENGKKTEEVIDLELKSERD